MLKIPEIKDPFTDCSALLLRPKQPFFDWLEGVLKRGPNPSSPGEVYFSEEDSVWLIPKIGRFPSETEFKVYLNSLKPRLLQIELSQFAKGPNDLPKEMSPEGFDKMFNLEVRDSVRDIRRLV